MSTIPSGPPPIQHIVPTHAPIGKPAVGLESVVDKDAPLPPIEDVPEDERLHHRDVIVKLSGDAQHGHDRQPSEEEQQPAGEDVQAQAAAVEPRIALIANPYRARHLADFEPHTLPPGSLLDQEV